MSRVVYLEVDTELKPVQLAIMVNMLPDVNDARIMDKITEVTTAASPDSDTTTKAEKNATNPS